MQVNRGTRNYVTPARMYTILHRHGDQHRDVNMRVGFSATARLALLA